jgi:hypothetical protein
MSGVPWPILLKLLAGGVPAVLIGTQLTTIVSPRKMRLALCVWLIYIGVQLSWRAMQTPPAAKPNRSAVLMKKGAPDPRAPTKKLLENNSVIFGAGSHSSIRRGKSPAGG